MNDIRPTRNELNFSRFAETTLANLSDAYANLKPGTDAQDFIREILNVVGTLDNPAVEIPLEIVKQFISTADRETGDEWIASSPYGAVVVSCAYCLRAMRANNAGHFNLAWSFMADARYWAGVAVSSKGLGQAYKNTVAVTTITAAAEAMKMNGQKGGAERSKLYDPVKTFVFERVRNRGKLWDSRRQACMEIAGPAIEFMRTQPKIKKIPSEDSIKQRIDDWMLEMPDLHALVKDRSKSVKQR